MSVSDAVAQAWRLYEDGADMIDIGGESSQPNAPVVSEADELARVLPVIQALQQDRFPLPLSIDTYKPRVMQAAVDAGVTLLNDIQGFRCADSVAMVAQLIKAYPHLSVCVMHMQGTPQTMQHHIAYADDDVVSEVCTFLSQQRQRLIAQGVPSQSIWLDVGFGFGKTLAHNIALFRALPQMVARYAPDGAEPCAGLMVGVSRKSMLGAITQRKDALISPPPQRVASSVAAAVLAVQAGAMLLRVHDVRETREALMVQSVLQF
jgi:dihydropteroate synthase